MGSWGACSIFSPARDPRLSSRRLCDRTLRIRIGSRTGVRRHDFRARVDFSAFHDRSRDRFEKNHQCGNLDPCHRGIADPGRRRRWSGIFLSDGLPVDRRKMGCALSGNSRRAEQHRDYREGALRQAGTRHAAGPRHAGSFSFCKTCSSFFFSQSSRAWTTSGQELFSCHSFALGFLLRPRSPSAAFCCHRCSAASRGCRNWC